MAAAAEIGTPEVAAPVAAPAKPAAVEVKPAAKAEAEKPKPRAVSADPVAARESNIAKFAKSMNADAAEDGVQVDAPPEHVRAKPGPKPGSKRETKPEPAAAKPAAKLVIDDTETDSEVPDGDTIPAPPPDDDDADTGKPEPRAAHQLKAKARLRHGDVDKAIKLAFGDLKPEEFDGAKELLAKKLGVGSKQWAEFRQFQGKEKAAARQLLENGTKLSQRLQADFQPMIDARKAYRDGDYPRAFELAFEGADLNDFNRKAIHQKLSQDPEKVRMAQRLEELERKVAQGAAPPQQQQLQPAEAQAQAMQREGDRTHKALTEQTDDPEIAHFAKKTAFVKRVVELRGEHYDPQSRTTISLRDAAEMARDELKRAMDEWRYDNAPGAAASSSELPALAGNEPVRTSQRARSPNPSLAAQAGGSTRSMTREERIKAFASRM